MIVVRHDGLNVRLIPVLQNNVAYLLIQGNEAVVVDPGDAEPILAYVRAHGLRLADIWITHGHPDHVGGVARLQAATGARLTAPAETPSMSGETSGLRNMP